MNYFRNQKKQTIKNIRNQIEEKEPIEKNKLISLIEIEIGASKNKAQEYLETLEIAGKIKLEDGNYSVK